MRPHFYSAIILILLIQVNNALYYDVTAEKCPQLHSVENLFDKFLLPCGVYASTPAVNECLTEEQQTAALKTLPSDWVLTEDSVKGNSISRVFQFPDFQNAFLFMSQGAQLAEKNQHHPDWSNLYNTVNVKLTTDDKACLGAFDIALARGLDYAYLRITNNDMKL